MMAPHFTLPDGRKGQALAISLTIIVLALLWLCTAAPLIGWYEARADELAQQEMLLAHMKALSEEIPVLHQAVNAAGLQSDDDQVLLTGSSDVLAGAILQATLQNLATQAGTNVDSAALLPAQQIGSLRRISMQVSVTTTWPVIVALLEAIGTARPRMIVDQISLANTMSATPSQETPLQANFSVTAFRAGSP